MITRRVTLPGGLGVELFEAGEGQHDRLLVVHGFTGAKEDFEDHIDALAARGWHVVAPDHRGHGASDKPAGVDSYSFSIMADDMFGVADALGWDRFVLLGHSMGGMIAQEMVTARPERIGALILMDTSPACPDGLDADSVNLGREVVREGGLALLVQVQAEQGIDPLSTAAHLRLVAERPGYAERGAQLTLACADDMWLSMVDQIVNLPDTCERLAAVSVPTLVIVGEQDTPFMAHSERMTKTIAGAQLAVIPDAGHSPQFESPDAWSAALNAFLDRVHS
jgi:pimeloyl-ACP methyl ester carboxylesterase